MAWPQVYTTTGALWLIAGLEKILVYTEGWQGRVLCASLHGLWKFEEPVKKT